MWQYTQTTELYHHGILGMHWHHRKSSGVSGGSNVPSSKSNHQTKLEEKYKSEGMSKKEAEATATKRIKAEKTLAIIGGATVVAVSAYAIAKHYKNTVDKTIKMGTELQNMSTKSNRGVEDAFYASMNNRDNTKYRGLYGNQLRNSPMAIMSGHPESVYETKIKSLGNIKVASQKNAANALGEMLKGDKDSAEAIEKHLNNINFARPGQQKTLAKAQSALRKGKIDKNVYEAFNLSLTDHSDKAADDVAKKFYGHLKTKGYGAIQDINDMKYSGYQSKSPVIVFDGAKNLVVDRVREVGENEIATNMKKGYADIVGTTLVKKGAAILGIYGGAKLIQKSANDIADTKPKINTYPRRCPAKDG